MFFYDLKLTVPACGYNEKQGILTPLKLVMKMLAYLDRTVKLGDQPPPPPPRGSVRWVTMSILSHITVFIQYIIKFGYIEHTLYNWMGGGGRKEGVLFTLLTRILRGSISSL
jgi:hypothetical protein